MSAGQIPWRQITGAPGLTVQDENSNVATAVTQLDFQGAGVTVTPGTGEVVITIPGGSSSGSTALGAGVSRRSTSMTAATGARTVTFDTTDRADTGYTVNLAAGTIAVPTAGWYAVHGKVRIAAGNSGYCRPGVMANGTYVILGNQIAATNTIEAAVSGLVYLAAGDAVTLDFYSVNSTQVTFSADGTFTYLRVVALTGGGSSGGGATTASGVSFTPAGNLSATNVQSALTELDNEKAANTGWVVVAGTGIDPTGATDSSTAVNAILSAMTAGQTAWFPAGTYKVAGLNAVSGTTIKGGAGTVLQAPSSAITPILTINAKTDVTVEGLTFQGNLAAGAALALTAPSGAQEGIKVLGQPRRIVIRNCMFRNFGCYGFHAASTGDFGGGSAPGAWNKLTDCEFDNCYRGMWFDQRAEYWAITGCASSRNRFGVQVNGGNNVFTSCHFSANYMGAYVANDTNSGHGSFAGCTFNHSTNVALEVDEQNNGYSFTGCQFFSGRIVFYLANGVVMTGCEFGSIAFEFQGGGRNSITNCFNAGSCTVTHNVAGVTDNTVLTNVFNAAGTSLA